MEIAAQLYVKFATRISRGSLKCPTSYNTSNMRKHILSKHREVSLAQESTPCTSKSTAPGMQPSSTVAMQKQRVYDINDPRAKAISKHIGTMIVKDLQPFSIVEDVGFQGLMKHIVPQYNIPSRRYFVDNAMGELYHDTRAKLVNSISSVKQLSLTTDIWSFRTNDGYIGVTAHYIDINWNRVNATVGCSLFKERHTALDISRKLSDICNDWSIRDKIITDTRDNGANIVAAIKLMDIDAVPCSTLQYPAVPCLAHTLQRVIHDGVFTLSSVQDMLSVCRHIVSHYHHSHVASSCFTRNQQQLDLPSHTLIQDIDTRWNSTFYMLESLLQQRKAISVTSSELNLDYDISIQQWTTMEKVSYSYYNNQSCFLVIVMARVIVIIVAMVMGIVIVIVIIGNNMKSDYFHISFSNY